MIHLREKILPPLQTLAMLLRSLTRLSLRALMLSASGLFSVKTAWRLKTTDDFDGTNNIIPSFCAEDQNHGNSDDHHLLHPSGTLCPHAALALLCEMPVAGLGMIRSGSIYMLRCLLIHFCIF